MSNTPVQLAVSQYFNIPYEDIVGSSRSQHIVRVRHIAFYLERTLLDRTFSDIERLYMRNDTGSVLAAYNHMAERVAKNDDRYVPHILALELVVRHFEKEQREQRKKEEDLDLLCCPTCGGPVIKEMRRQINELKSQINMLKGSWNG